MNADRIQEIQATTALPNSKSVAAALFQVWNECSQAEESLLKQRDMLVEALEDIVLSLDESRSRATAHSILKAVREMSP